MVNEACPTPTSPPPPLKEAAARNSWVFEKFEFLHISMNNKKPREALHAPDVFKEKKYEVLTRTMSHYEFSHWYPHYDLPLQL